ncbi:MAG: hypothetical protein ACMXX5_02015 [Candidatus Woesearchaeota archaeon]
MNKRKLLFYFNRIMWYFVVVIPFLILFSMSMMGMTSNEIDDAIFMFFNFVKSYILMVLLISFIFALILWFILFFKARYKMNKVIREHEQLKERSEIQKLKRSIHRD